MPEHRLRFDREDLRRSLMRKYAQVAEHPDWTFHFVSGSPQAERLGYERDWLEAAPSGAVESFSGVGKPWDLGLPSPGDIVLDAGCGSGLDSFVASRFVGERGRVVGIDMTPEMVEKARCSARADPHPAGSRRTTFWTGHLEDLPLADGTVDLAVSNGSIYLCPDKRGVFRELHRVLVPGGRIQIAEVFVEEPVPDSARDLIRLWTKCVAGGLPRTEFEDTVRSVGFRDVQVHRSYDAFEDARMADWAERFGARGHLLSAVRP